MQVLRAALLGVPSPTTGQSLGGLVFADSFIEVGQAPPSQPCCSE